MHIVKLTSEPKKGRFPQGFFPRIVHRQKEADALIAAVEQAGGTATRNLFKYKAVTPSDTGWPGAEVLAEREAARNLSNYKTVTPSDTGWPGEDLAEREAVRGRPKKDERVLVSVRLPESIVALLRMLAEEGRRPFTTQMEIALEEGLKVLGYDA